MPRRRKAKFDAPLIIIDGLQLICLKSQRTRLIAVAVPKQPDKNFDFVAVSVSPENWEKYFENRVDLRYLFTYPTQKTIYTMDSSQETSSGEFIMTVYEDTLPEDLLPGAGLFSSDHTEEYGDATIAGDTQQLFIDGGWEMTEFGRFYQKYSDVYAFVAALRNYINDSVDSKIKSGIADVFKKKPFQGGSSYLHMFNELTDFVPRDQRVTLDKIQYASPGDVQMNGSGNIFYAEKEIIQNYIMNRRDIQNKYNVLHRYLSKNGLLAMAGGKFSGNREVRNNIMENSILLCNLIKIGNFPDIYALSQNNELVSAKVILSVTRRIDAAAAFFSEGRMAFYR